MAGTSRIAAAEALWDDALRGGRPIDAVRLSFREILWDRETAPDLRLRCAQLLLGDDRPEAAAQNAALVRLMLPTEPDRRVVAEFCRAAADAGWTETADAVVRRLAIDDTEIPGAERVEAVALRTLLAPRGLEDAVFTVFVSGDAPPGFSAALDWPGRVRSSAWAVLSRLDPTGEARRALLERPPPAGTSTEAAAMLAVLREASRDLRALPDTEGEFDWLGSLRDGTDANAAWWSQTEAAVERAAPRVLGALRVRHLEPIRWASLHRPDWLVSTRAELMSRLRAALAGRTHHARWAEGEITRRAGDERLEDWADSLRWPDLVALLVVDEAVRDPEVVRAVRAYTLADRQDKDTEYGGVLEARPGGAGFRAVLFPPRQRDRVGDGRFIASSDMIAASDRALAHFHLQVARVNSGEFAGPSPADLAYVERGGRTGVVFTSVGRSQLNVDAYQPGGAVIDLGGLTLAD